ncbi:hypothetical protein J4558_17295 [Leptolyngbya sp. 15MV]|nr:hypothetical protein J4558_17295 [Leptolyngbya sp. 15MV]
MAWLARQYGRRIVNVNVNTLLAAALALAPTIWIVSLTRHWGIDDKLAIGAITFVADVVFDVAIYFGLHWLANGLPRRWGWISSKAHAHLSFLADASLVQAQRIVLAPLLYVIALGGQYGLMHQGVGREWATVIGFAAGLLVTRTLHTFWMIRESNARLRRMEAAPPPLGSTSTTPRSEGA